MFSWVAVEASTGRVIADLPGVRVDSIKRTLGRYESTTAVLPLPGAPENWGRATLPGGACLVLLVDNPSDPAHGVPVWGGLVTAREMTEGDTVSLSVATLESYLDRRYVGDETFTGVGQNVIVSQLVTTYVAAGVSGGLPIRVVSSGGATTRDREYKAQDDKTIYSVLTDLMGVDGGPEWSIDWEWSYSPDRLTPVFRVADRIGVAVTPGLGAAATFELPGSVQSVSYSQDYSAGRGANSVLAVSSGQGDTRPESAVAVLDDLDRPTFEFRYTPSTSITAVSTLNSYAASALAALGAGTASLALTSVVDGAPVLGVDWSLGDDVGFKIGGLNDAGVDTVPGFPGGLSGVARAIGWELTLGETQLVTPVLAGSEIP